MTFLTHVVPHVQMFLILLRVVLTQTFLCLLNFSSCLHLIFLLLGTYSTAWNFAIYYVNHKLARYWRVSKFSEQTSLTSPIFTFHESIVTALFKGKHLIITQPRTQTETSTNMHQLPL